MSLRTTLLLSTLVMRSIISPNPVRAEEYGQISVPEFQKSALLNGMEIIFLSGVQDRVHFLVAIKNGAAFDPATKWGVTYLTSKMLLEGLENQAGESFLENLRQLDAELDFLVHWDAISFFGTSSTQRALDVLNLLGEMVVRPRFEEDTFQRLRAELVQELQEENNHPGHQTQTLFLKELFQANPYSHSIRGTPRTLKNLTLADIKIQYRKLFIPNQVQLAFHYDEDREQALNSLGRGWGRWIKSRPLPFTFRRAERPDSSRILLLDSPGENGLIRMGGLSVEMGSRDHYALKVFENYLTLSLPEIARSTVSETQIRASVELANRMMPGYWQLNLEAPANHLVSYVKKILDFMDNLKKAPLDSVRFEEAKRLTYQEIIDSLSQPFPRLDLLFKTNLYNLGVNFISHYGTRLKRLTPKSLGLIVSKYVSPETYLLLVSGPADTLRPELDKLGKVEVIQTEKPF